jgi:hypothetical protein
MMTRPLAPALVSGVSGGNPCWLPAKADPTTAACRLGMIGENPNELP